METTESMIQIIVNLVVIIFCVALSILLINRINKKVMVLIMTVLLIPYSRLWFSGINGIGENIAVIIHSFIISLVMVIIMSKISSAPIEYSTIIYYMLGLLVITLVLNFFVFSIIYGFPNYNPIQILRFKGVLLQCDSIWGHFVFTIFPYLGNPSYIRI